MSFFDSTGGAILSLAAGIALIVWVLTPFLLALPECRSSVWIVDTKAIVCPATAEIIESNLPNRNRRVECRCPAKEQNKPIEERELE